jgi:hypothetical protein
MNKQETIAKINAAGGTRDMGDKFTKYQDTIRDIARKGRVETNKIIVHETADHKNISLWTKEGKRIGPLHPHNARHTFEMFWELGIELSAEQPTEAEVAAYMETDEYKKKRAAYEIIRAKKDKSRSSKNIDKMIKAIADMQGKTVEAIHGIVKPGEVGRKKGE